MFILERSLLWESESEARFRAIISVSSLNLVIAVSMLKPRSYLASFDEQDEAVCWYRLDAW
jgi:hypothetical protein